jgi:hypothetical protein
MEIANQSNQNNSKSLSVEEICNTLCSELKTAKGANFRGEELPIYAQNLSDIEGINNYERSGNGSIYINLEDGLDLDKFKGVCEEDNHYSFNGDVGGNYVSYSGSMSKGMMPHGVFKNLEDGKKEIEVDISGFESSYKTAACVLAQYFVA